MIFNGNLGFVFGGRGVIKFNVCVTTLGTDGTWYGADGVFGEITPNATITNQILLAFKWKADGTFVVQFGLGGNEKIFDVPDIKIYSKFQDTPVLLVWNEINAQYEVSDNSDDLALATLLIAKQAASVPRLCFDFEIKPVEIISYNYNSETS